MSRANADLYVATLIQIECVLYFFFQAEDGIRDRNVTGVQTCALPICRRVERRQAEASGCQNRSYQSRSFNLLHSRSRSSIDRKSVVVGKECRSRWLPYH